MRGPFCNIWGKVKGDELRGLNVTINLIVFTRGAGTLPVVVLVSKSFYHFKAI